MDGVKKWMLDNQVFSGIAGVVLVGVFGAIGWLFNRRSRTEPVASNTVQTGHVGAGNVFNISGPVGSLAVGGTPPAAPRRNLSEAANHLLMEIMNDARSDPKGLSLMTTSSTHGFYVPYLWDNQAHGQLMGPRTNILRIRMAADELIRSGYLQPIQESEQLKLYVLKLEHEWLT